MKTYGVRPAVAGFSVGIAAFDIVLIIMVVVIITGGFVVVVVIVLVTFSLQPQLWILC